MIPCDDMLPGCAREFGTITENQKNGEERDKVIIRKLDAISMVILGNGKQGLVGRVRTLETERLWLWKITLVTLPILTALAMVLFKKWVG